MGILCMSYYVFKQNTRFFYNFTTTKDNICSCLRKSGHGAFSLDSEFICSRVSSGNIEFLGFAVSSLSSRFEQVGQYVVKTIHRICWFWVYFSKIWLVLFQHVWDIVCLVNIFIYHKYLPANTWRNYRR